MENVCQWTTLFEALSPLETCISNKERETSTNYTLDEFQAMHLPFGLPVAPREGKTCFHRLIILLESPPQSSGVLLPLGSPPFEPLIQAFALSLPQHAGKFLDQLVGLGNLRVLLAELGQIALLPLQTLFFFKGHPMSNLQSGGRPFLLYFLCVDHRGQFGFDRLEAAGFAFVCT